MVEGATEAVLDDEALSRFVANLSTILEHVVETAARRVEAGEEGGWAEDAAEGVVRGVVAGLQTAMPGVDAQLSVLADRLRTALEWRAEIDRQGDKREVGDRIRAVATAAVRGVTDELTAAMPQLEADLRTLAPAGRAVGDQIVRGLVCAIEAERDRLGETLELTASRASRGLVKGIEDEIAQLARSAEARRAVAATERAVRAAAGEARRQLRERGFEAVHRAAYAAGSGFLAAFAPAVRRQAGLLAAGVAVGVIGARLAGRRR